MFERFGRHVNAKQYRKEMGYADRIILVHRFYEDNLKAKKEHPVLKHGAKDRKI